MSSSLSWLVLLCLMATELRLATICAFATAIPCLVLAVIFGGAVGKLMLTMQERTDRRVVTLREVLFGAGKPRNRARSLCQAFKLL